ncbi:MAG: hypothetical protein Kow0080_02940 [Candidatus Promineifilaceae bacterium]
MSEQIDTLKEDEKARLADELGGPNSLTRHHRHETNNWIAGVVLILIGGLFLLANVTGVYIHNWWAFFLLIPVIANFDNALRQYRENGRFTEAVRGSLMGGLFMLTIFSIFIFGWSWGTMWPLFIIVFGIGALLSGLME